MSHGMRGRYWAALVVAIPASTASAEFVGWYVDGPMIVGECRIVDVYAQFDTPNDVLRSVFNARISARVGDGEYRPFVHHVEYGQGWDRPRHQLLLADSFVCIGHPSWGLDEAIAGRAPLFWPDDAPPEDASWSACPSQPDQGRVDPATYRVLVGRFAVEAPFNALAPDLRWAANIAYDQGDGTETRYGWNGGEGSGPTFQADFGACVETQRMDMDGDGVPDCMDNCAESNPDQQDCDADGWGDECQIPLELSASVPTFQLQPAAAGGSSYSFSIQVPFGSSFDSFSFTGTVSGLEGTDAYASDLKLLIGPPCWTEPFEIGGADGTVSNPWAFQGLNPGMDGTYSQPPTPGIGGTAYWFCEHYYFTFVHDGDGPKDPEMTWTNVELRLLDTRDSYPTNDCNQNGVGDLCDLAVAGADVDGNGVLDECEDHLVVDVPAEAPTIQAAIDLAQDGWIIRVAPGVYRERIVLGSKRIELKSVAGPEVTVIDGESVEGSVVRIIQEEGASCPGPEIRGFTIRGGLRGSPIGTSQTLYGGGGIYAAHARATIRGCIIEGNQADYGGGLYLWRSEVALENCLVRGNVAAVDGGGCQFFRGGGGARRCVFEANIASGSGGGIHGVLGMQTLLENEVRGNAAAIGGGLSLYVDAESTVSLIGSVVESNTASSTGGGIWIRPGFTALRLGDSAVCFNSPTNVVGSFTDLGGNDFCPCVADVDVDGTVGGSDLAAVLASWGPCGTNACETADLDGNGVVGGGDLSILLAAWGPCR